jgi:transcriptional regulator with XRE-family HTH domain
VEAALILRTARRRAGLTQRELARRAGVPQPTVSRIEGARMSPTLDTLLPLVGACGMQLTLEDVPGSGVDRSQIRERLRLSPTERLGAAVGSQRNIARMIARASAVSA